MPRWLADCASPSLSCPVSHRVQVNDSHLVYFWLVLQLYFSPASPPDHLSLSLFFLLSAGVLFRAILQSSVSSYNRSYPIHSHLCALTMFVAGGIVLHTCYFQNQKTERKDWRVTGKASFVTHFCCWVNVLFTFHCFNQTLPMSVGHIQCKNGKIECPRIPKNISMK